MRFIGHRGVREAGRNGLQAGEQGEINMAKLPAGRYAFYCDKRRPFMQSHAEVWPWPAPEAL